MIKQVYIISREIERAGTHYWNGLAWTDSKRSARPFYKRNEAVALAVDMQAKSGFRANVITKY